MVSVFDFTENFPKKDFQHKVWFQFLISQRIFPKRIFSTKFGFSFPLSRKIFRLQFPLIFLRKNRSEALCVSSENILHLTFCGLKMWRKPTPSLYKYNQNFKLNNCAISKIPETSHIFKPLLNAVLYFRNLKDNSTFLHKVWFSVFYFRANLVCRQRLVCHAKFGFP